MVSLKPVMYSQLQPWSTVVAPPCMEQIGGPGVPVRLGNYYETPRPHPWRPTLGYEYVLAYPLPSQPVTNALVDPCYTPSGMATEPIKFPNLVTGFERNPAHAARAALYTRYTPHEWVYNNVKHYNEADTARNYAERLRNSTVRTMRETDELTATDQRDSGRRLGERITDTTFWRNESANELQQMIAESNLLQEKRRALEKCIQDLEGPLHIAQECLYHRENRRGIDLVHDEVEQALLKEVETLRNCQNRLKALYENLTKQLTNNRAAQFELERDVNSKEGAIGMDNMCYQLNNFSPGITYYGGIEKFDPTVSTEETWAEHSHRIIQRAKTERAKSAQFRTDTDTLISVCASEVWDRWNATNNALARRAAELLSAKIKLQTHLQKIQTEIFDVEKNMELIRKAITDKSNPMKVAHTRLEARTHRRDIELCRDGAQLQLVQEVKDIGQSIATLNRRLMEMEAQHQQLLKTRANLESDLDSKVNSLFIDREKCLGMRRCYPITATIKY